MIFIPRTCYMNTTLVFRSILYQVDIDEVNILIAGWFFCPCYTNALDDYWPLGIIMHGTHITECMKIAHASVCQTHI